MKGTKLDIKFNTSSGLLNIHDMWGVHISVVDMFLINMQKELATEVTESFIKPAPKANKIKELQFEIAKAILEQRVADLDKATKSKANRIRREKLLEIKAGNEDKALLEISPEDLDKLIAETEQEED